MTAAIVFLALASSVIVGEEAPLISSATHDNGVLIHEVSSEFQKGNTRIRVLLPDVRGPNETFPVIYILPVEAREEARYGDGLLEVKAQELHNRHRVIFVAPTFSHLPWYADHPTDRTIRQESYLLKVVVPFTDKTYPAKAGSSNRLLIGFSKSGWGAWSLLLRHPDFFGRAAAWDAPLMMNEFRKYGAAPIFGTQENFETYKITRLVQEKAEILSQSKRLIVTGYGNFRREQEQIHALLQQLKVPHDYRDGAQRKHDWNSGWLPEAVELLVNAWNF